MATGHPYDTASMKSGNVPRFRNPYRFVSGGKVLTWERRIPGDSRVEQITCSAEWFYAQMLPRGSS